jgi:hypothetical protein
VPGGGALDEGGALLVGEADAVLGRHGRGELMSTQATLIEPPVTLHIEREILAKATAWFVDEPSFARETDSLPSSS